MSCLRLTSCGREVSDGQLLRRCLCQARDPRLRAAGDPPVRLWRSRCRRPTRAACRPATAHGVGWAYLDARVAHVGEHRSADSRNAAPGLLPSDCGSEGCGSSPVGHPTALVDWTSGSRRCAAPHLPVRRINPFGHTARVGPVRRSAMPAPAQLCLPLRPNWSQARRLPAAAEGSCLSTNVPSLRAPIGHGVSHRRDETWPGHSHRGA